MTTEITSQAEQLLFTTVRLETDHDDGLCAGTGFFYNYAEGDSQYAFVVSNKHVVSGGTNGRLLLTRAENGHVRLGERVTVELPRFGSRWFGHADPDVDIAVMPLVPLLEDLKHNGREIFFKSISDDLIPTPEVLSDLDAIEEMVFIGYPNGIFDTVNLTPVVRTGSTATPIRFNYCGNPAFLIDASVFPGSSGSPVFIFNQGTYPVRAGVAVGTRLHFVGILAKVLIQVDKGEFEMVEIPTSQVASITFRQLIDLGYVFRSELVRETATQFLQAFRGGKFQLQ